MHTAMRQPFIGFIFVIREDLPTYKYVKSYSYVANTIVRGSVPKKALLSDKRVKAHLTHCGGNNILESLYFGKVVMGYPIGGMDQPGAC